jgi:hypothetical protein
MKGRMEGWKGGRMGCWSIGVVELNEIFGNGALQEGIPGTQYSITPVCQLSTLPFFHSLTIVSFWSFPFVPVLSVVPFQSPK